MTSFSDRMLVQLITNIKGIFHPSMIEQVMFGVGMELGRSVVPQALGPRAVPLPHRQNDYLRCAEWIRANWKWEITTSAATDSQLTASCRNCPFPELAQSEPSICRMEMGVLGGISDELFKYGKVSLQRSHDHSPRDCRFTVYTERTPQSIAAGGWSCPPSPHEKERKFDVEAAAQMRAQLTQREQQILALLAEGFSDKQIATALKLSVRTVEGHLGRVREKTALRSRSALIRFALRITAT